MQLNFKNNLNFFKLSCSYKNYPYSHEIDDADFFDNRENIANKKKLREFNLIKNGYNFIHQYDDAMRDEEEDEPKEELSKEGKADREAILKSKEYSGLSEEEKKIKFNKMIDEFREMFKDMDRARNNDTLRLKKDHIKNLDIFNFKKKKLFKKINQTLNKVNLTIEYKAVLNKNKNDLVDFLINIIKKRNIIYNTQFLKLLIILNTKWFNNLEISYLVRKALDLVDNKLVILCIAYSDMSSLEYTIWEEIEVFHHPFFKKYKKYLTPYKKYLKGNKATKENCEISYEKIAVLRIVDSLKLKKKNYSPCHLKSELKNYYLAKNQKEHIKMLNYNDDIYKKRYQKISLTIQDVYKQFGILDGNKKWKNQNILFENITNILKPLNIDVFKEYRPKELKRQSLDIYFEHNKKKYGVEYQGQQHYIPVKFFGGKKALSLRKKLDGLKKRRCKKAKIKLIEFKYSEQINLPAIVKKLKLSGIKLKGGNYVGNI